MTTTSEATMTTQHGPNGPDPTPEPLGPGWLTVTVVIGVLAAIIAIAGMVLSFHAVSVRMTPSFGPRWAWLVPLVVDLTVLVFSGVDLVLARRGIPHPLARWTVYGATFGTVWLNYAAGGDLTGRIAHILMPSVWVMFIELMRHVVRHEANLVGVSLRQPIPAARWLLAPWPTLKLWRRMILWQVHSYTRALDHERERLRKTAALRQEHGRLWRWKVTPLVRLELNLGPAEPDPARTELNPAAGSGGSGSGSDANQNLNLQENPQRDARTNDANPGAGTQRNRTRTRVANQDRRSEPAARTSTVRQKRLAIVREMAELNNGNVTIPAIMLRFGCSKTAAFTLRRDVLAERSVPGSSPDGDDAETEGEAPAA